MTLDILHVQLDLLRERYIAAAAHLKTRRPGTSFAVLEGRDSIGGTWSLFQYPGIRSDSDMPTFGYSFKPWTHRKSIADGHIIMDYLQQTVTDNGQRQTIGGEGTALDTIEFSIERCDHLAIESAAPSNLVVET